MRESVEFIRKTTYGKSLKSVINRSGIYGQRHTVKVCDTFQ